MLTTSQKNFSIMSTSQKIGIVSLITLSLQSSTFVLVLRFSRTGSSDYYKISTAVLLSEALKFITSFALLLAEEEFSISLLIHRLKMEIMFDYHETFKLALPAALYFVQNTLLFVALSNLDAATYEVTYQFRILTTAIFSWLLLGKKLKFIHWFALSLLMFGVSLVQVDVNVITKTPNVTDQHGQQILVMKPPGPQSSSRNLASGIIGLLAVFVCCFSSGFSGVYFEVLVKKGKNSSLLIRNLQLGIFSLVFASIGIYWDRVEISKGGFFKGYYVSTWVVIIMQALGGLIVSVTMKYSNNILKVFATSISIVISTLISWLLLGDKTPSVLFVLGTCAVIVSTILYGSDPGAKSVKSTSAEEEYD